MHMIHRSTDDHIGQCNSHVGQCKSHVGQCKSHMGQCKSRAPSLDKTDFPADYMAEQLLTESGVPNIPCWNEHHVPTCNRLTDFT